MLMARGRNPRAAAFSPGAAGHSEHQGQSQLHLKAQRLLSSSGHSKRLLGRGQRPARERVRPHPAWGPSVSIVLFSRPDRGRGRQMKKPWQAVGEASETARPGD